MVNSDGDDLENQNDYAVSAVCHLVNAPAGDWIQGGGDASSTFNGIGWHIETGEGHIRTLGGLDLAKFNDTVFHHQSAGWLILGHHVGGTSWVHSPIHGWLGLSDLAGGFAYHFDTRTWIPLD